MTKFADRFWSRVLPPDENGCRMWTGAKTGQRGYVGRDGKVLRTSRVAYELHYGVHPGNLMVCHKCDRTNCCEPSHLFLGTTNDNMADMVGKCRQTAGERDAQAKLCAEEAALIRASVGTHNRIASYFGVTRKTVGNIQNGISWTHTFEAKR